MSKNEEKNSAEQVEQTAPAETPEPVQEQLQQVGSETAAEVAAQLAAPTEAQEAPEPDTPKRPEIVVADPRGLNLREGPHVSYAAIAVLPDGDPVEILDLPKNVEVRGWALVETDAGIGWVNTNFLKEVEI